MNESAYSPPPRKLFKDSAGNLYLPQGVDSKGRPVGTMRRVNRDGTPFQKGPSKKERRRARRLGAPALP